LEALEDRRPPLVMLENVSGFLTANGGRDFATAAKTLASLGYWLDAMVLDARCFTPQSRKRVFVLAKSEAKTGTPRAHILRPPDLVDRLCELRLPTGLLGLDLPAPPTRRTVLADVLERGDDLDWWNEHEVERHYRMLSDAHRRRIDEWRAGGSHVGAAFRRVRRDGQRLEVRFDGLAGCLRTPRGGSAKQIVVAVDAGRLRMRWMTPREYARLQGVDDFPTVGTRNQQLFAFGDAVCVPVIRWIDEHVLTPLYESTRPARRNGRAGQPPP
jgi:DNA (cytosine-5)-methyltransferase 1